MKAPDIRSLVVSYWRGHNKSEQQGYACFKPCETPFITAMFTVGLLQFDPFKPHHLAWSNAQSESGIPWYFIGKKIRQIQ